MELCTSLSARVELLLLQELKVRRLGRVIGSVLEALYRAVAVQ